MDNPATLETLGTQDTGRRQIHNKAQTHNTHIQKISNDDHHQPHQNPLVNSGASKE